MPIVIDGTPTGLTQVTITHAFVNADLSPASGSVIFTLTKRLTNTGVSLMPSSKIVATLSDTGELSQALISNSDASSTPTDTQWRVDFEIAGASVDSETITVPVGPGSMDLGALLPEAQQVQ